MLLKSTLKCKKDAEGNTIKVEKTAQRWVKNKVNSTAQGLVDQLNKELSMYMKHIFYMEHQRDTLKQKREEGLGETEIFMWVDFAENWATPCEGDTKRSLWWVQAAIHNPLSQWLLDGEK